jgi:glutamate synthase (NADPH) small chain
MEVSRKEPGYRSPEQRVRDYRAVEKRLTERDLLEQAARCMDCGVPFCHAAGCPVHNIIPEFNDAVYHRNWREALKLLLNGCCFPEFTGRICPAPCETSCVLGINDEPVTIRQIELTIIEEGFERGYMKPRIPETRHPEPVAVIGSGPAGLAVADVLNRSGYNVVVYENASSPGGILRYGIPDFKLEKWVVDRRVRLMESEGVTFECGVEIGVDLSYRFLERRYGAVVLTGGAREPRDLDVPGRELDGIHFAMDFLTQQNMRGTGEPLEPGQITAKDRTVVVIGGGDTGADCLGTSWRHGARDCYQFEILPEPPPERPPETPWPMWPNQRRDSSSHKEGGARRWSVRTTEFIGRDGRVAALKGKEVEWQDAEDTGRPVPVGKDGSEFTIEADLVLLAMGFVGPGRNRLVEQLDLALDRRGFVQKDETGMTSRKGVFVAGDMHQGASLVVRAIQDGKDTAEMVMRYLERQRDRAALRD